MKYDRTNNQDLRQIYNAHQSKLELLFELEILRGALSGYQKTPADPKDIPEIEKFDDAISSLRASLIMPDKEKPNEEYLSISSAFLRFTNNFYCDKNDLHPVCLTKLNNVPTIIYRNVEHDYLLAAYIKDGELEIVNEDGYSLCK